MRYWQPFGNSDPDASYQNGDPSLGVEGSIPPAGAIEDPQREIINVLKAAGITPTASDRAQLLQSIRALFRQRLRGNLTVYVRLDGSDSNDGSANTPTKAFASLQGAWNQISNIYDTANYNIDIQLGQPGTYAGASFGFFSGRVRIIGGGSAQDGYTINSPLNAPYVIQSRVQGLEIVNVTLDYTYTGAAQVVEATVWAAPGGTITLTGVSWRNGANRANLTHNFTDYQSAIQLSGGQYFVLGAGSIASFANSASGNFIGAFGSTLTTITTQGNLTVTDAWCISVSGGIASFFNVTYSNAFATGSRYRVDRLGLINVSGGGANFLPGSTAGTATNGGIYA